MPEYSGLVTIRAVTKNKTKSIVAMRLDNLLSHNKVLYSCSNDEGFITLNEEVTMTSKATSLHCQDSEKV